MSEAAAEQQQQQQQQPSAGRVAAAVARGCIGRPKVECTAEFAVSLLKKEFDLSAAAEDEIQRLQQIAEKVLKEVVEVASGSDEIEAFAAAAVDKEDPFEKNEKTKDAQACAPVATKAELQAAVKTLGMGPAAYRGLPKDNPAAYCKGLRRHLQELQSRVLTFIKNISGDVLSSLPSAEQLSELKKAAEAKKELSSLDASNIIQGRPKRRAASSAAEAIKRDIQRELDREAAQASSQPHSKKQKTDKEEGAAAAASSSSSSSSSSNGGDVAERKKAKEEEEEDEEDEDEDEDSSSDNSDESDDSSSNSSSGSSSSSNDDEEEEDEDED
ncbi:hypothetical protein, conserved [Eimeria acervulina]|uniref:Histone chaperone domain-containing protein n=1 Tax=Eimeria acervulina TaxID=5801 RepID=U6G990_EIMAC|nr:hypothetical protein, conserved [Eimeria acervulina]CDI76087.1 hypothetical protein, conserved [Eimeria acervulina]